MGDAAVRRVAVSHLCRIEVLGLRVVDVSAERRFQFESLRQGQLDETQPLNTVGLVVLDGPLGIDDRVVARVVSGVGRGAHVVDIADRAVDQHLGKNVVRHIAVGRNNTVVLRLATLQINSHPEPAVDVNVQLAVECKAAHVRSDGDTVLVQITRRHGIGKILRTAPDRRIGFVRDGRTQDPILPVVALAGVLHRSVLVPVGGAGFP